MKTLNRPMFRYGGPIKEGVMNGIREPKRNGGSMMGNDEGPRRAALVGNPIYPKGPDGRTGHFIPIAIGLGLRGAAGVAARAAARRAAAKGAGAMGTGGVRGQVPAIFNNMSANMSAKAGSTAASAAKPGFLKSLFLDDPLFKASMYGYKALTGTGAKSLGQKAVKVALSPSSIIAGTAYYMWPDGKERLDPPPPESTDGKLGDGLVEQAKELSPEEIKAAENKARREKMDSYREIMDIKGMNKDAAYKSLIDASKIIQEGGNLKEQLKDGSLITNITAAASKRFDKVSDTENALRSLIAKGEITKEMNKEENALAKLLKQKQIEIADKSLAGKSMAEIISTRMEKGDMFQGSELASLLRVKKGIDAKVLPSGKMEQGQDPLDYITQIVATTNADETTPDYPDGVYVIKDRIIQVLEGQVIPVSINQLT